MSRTILNEYLIFFPYVFADCEYYEAKNMRELKEMCRRRGLTVGGTKPVLIRKLIKDDQGVKENRWLFINFSASRKKF